MNDIVLEWIIPYVMPAEKRLVKAVLVSALIMPVADAVLFYPILMLSAVILGIAEFFLFRSWKLEYEYVYVNGDFTISKIIHKAKCRDVFRCDRKDIRYVAEGKRQETGCTVSDFNLEIADKEFVIFVGPSGCGKSTTLRMIAGLEDISSGEFKIDGVLMNDVESKDRDIAKVFLMDKPLPNLDAKLCVQMRTEISKLHQRLGATIIYVTHDQTEAMTLGTRIVVMKDGVVQQIDTPQNLYNAPGNQFVAGFIGSPQMNFLNAVCQAQGNAVYLTIGGTHIRLIPDRAKKLIDGGYSGREAVMGIRQEDVTDSAAATFASKAVIRGTVNVYELLGAEVCLYFDMDNTQMTAKVSSATTIRANDTVDFALNTDKIHIFDKDTEVTITN